MSPELARLLAATTLATGDYERISSGDHATGLCEVSLPEEVKTMLREPDQLWHPPGTVLKPGSRSTVTQIDLAGASYVLKLYKSLAFQRRLRYALTRTRAMQSWQNGQVMAALGIPVIRPLAIIEEKRFGIPARAAILMDYVPGPSLLDLVEQDTAPSRLEDIADHLHEACSLMAAHQVTHGDQKATNIIVDDDNWPHFIDLDASLVARSSAHFLKARERDCQRFMKNWQTHPEAARIFRSVFYIA